MKISPTLSLLVAIALSGCSSAPTESRSTPPPPDDRRAAPWDAAYVKASEVAGPYVQEWRKADNRASCTPIAPPGVAERHPEARPRAANFSGGWAVAYDMPGLRSAFGVAGTGVTPDSDTYDEWPYQIEWRDGSVAKYGPEGGSGSNYLAYLEIQGEKCLYNVWSKLGKNDLETLLSELRFIDIR